MLGSVTTSRVIQRRLLYSGVFVVLVTLFASIVAATVTLAFMGDLNTRIGRSIDLGRWEKTLAVAISDQAASAFDYTASRDPAALERLRNAEARELDAYRAFSSADVSAEIATALDRVRQLAAVWRDRTLNPSLSAIGAGSLPTPPRVPPSNSDADIQLDTALDDLATTIAGAQAAERAAGQEIMAKVALIMIPLVGALLATMIGTWIWVGRRVSSPLMRLNAQARRVVNGIDQPFVAERDDEIGELAEVLESLRLDSANRYQSARLEADRAAVFNQLAELISFAQDEGALVTAAVRTLQRLAPSARGDIMLVNNSTNRLLVAAGWGDNPPADGPAPIDRIDRCPGIRRATAYIASDLADDLAVRCPAHSAVSGSVACVPMPALGTIVGVVHLERPEPHAFDADSVSVIARVAEQAALAIANARLMHTMEGLAMSDPLTGLRNSRFLDGYLERELAEGARDRVPTTLLMLDIDHFKVFNDTYGHPAGDEALRTFSRVLRSTVRSSDTLARYGGEEFVVALHKTGIDEGLLVAETIRAAVEQAVVEIGPGRYARITVSIGLATAEPGRLDSKSLLAIADSALYRAKEQGRNRVESGAPDESALAKAAGRRLGLRVREDTVTPIKHPTRSRRATRSEDRQAS